MLVIVAWMVLGLLMGAPLNHLADRLPHHQPLRGRPACERCGHPLQPGQWLAAWGAVAGRGRCWGCGAPLPRRRWLLELGLALLYGLLAWRQPLSWGLLAATLHASVLALITVTDLEHRKVPDAASLPAMAATIVYTALSNPGGLRGVLLGGAIGFGFFLLLTPFHMGMGDVKLAGYVGLIAGLRHVLPCLLLAIVAGGLVAGIGLATRRIARRSYIPYAPYLALGGVVALFLA